MITAFKHYDVITSPTIDTLKGRVDSALASGWYLHGNLFFVQLPGSIMFYQPVAKP